MTDKTDAAEKRQTEGTPAEVFSAFLKLGLTSFGGPAAHLGYFRDELVSRREWLSDHAYADLVALCQFLPGPASSQVGFGLGLMRAGWLGALHNARSVMFDHDKIGDAIWDRFIASKDETLWYYESLCDAFAAAWPENPLLPDLKAIVGRMREVVAAHK